MNFLHSKKKINDDLIHLGVKKGMYINLKCSYSALGNIEGGPMSLINIILDIIKENGLLVTDSFVRCYKVGSQKILKNIINNNSKSYAGLIANTILSHENCFRSYHPIQKFALIGNNAENLSSQHDRSSYAYNILKLISEEKNAFNLKIGRDDKVLGVGTTHVATGILNIEKYEQKLGVYYEDNKKKLKFFEKNWIGICKNTLINLNNFYEENKNIKKLRYKVGSTSALLTNMNQTLKEELKLFSQSKEYLSCGNKYCFECFTLKNNHGKHISFLANNILNFKIKNIGRFFFTKRYLQPTFRI